MCRGGETRAERPADLRLDENPRAKVRRRLDAQTCDKSRAEDAHDRLAYSASWRRHHLFERNGAHSGRRRTPAPMPLQTRAAELMRGRTKDSGEESDILGTHLSGIAAAPLQVDAFLHVGRPGREGGRRRASRRRRGADCGRAAARVESERVGAENATHVGHARRPPHNNNRCATAPNSAARRSRRVWQHCDAMQFLPFRRRRYARCIRSGFECLSIILSITMIIFNLLALH